MLIAGGHVAVLLNRMRLFRLGEELAKKPLIAWSAGAMALSERIVLFHHHAPQGRRDAELLDAGLGIVPAAHPAAACQNPARLEQPPAHGAVQPALFTGRLLHAGQRFPAPTRGRSAGVRAPSPSVITRSGQKRVLTPR